MMSSNGNIFRVTGLLCGEFTRSFDVFFDVCMNKQVSKRSWGWWSETPPSSLWHQCNEISCFIVHFNWNLFNLIYRSVEGLLWWPIEVGPPNGYINHNSDKLFPQILISWFIVCIKESTFFVSLWLVSSKHSTENIYTNTSFATYDCVLHVSFQIASELSI